MAITAIYFSKNLKLTCFVATVPLQLHHNTTNRASKTRVNVHSLDM